MRLFYLLVSFVLFSIEVNSVKVLKHRLNTQLNTTTLNNTPPLNMTVSISPQNLSLNVTGNSSKPIKAAVPLQNPSTGTLLNKYGGFCALKSKQCVAFCAKPNGDTMDENFNNFFCYASYTQAGDTFKCTSDDECVEEKSQKAKGKYCAGVQECKVTNLRKM